jgi:predicted ester cyclase
MSAKEIKALERRALEAFNKGKAAAMTFIDERFATNIVSHMADGREIRGLKDTKQFNSAFYDAFPDMHRILDDIVVEGDKAAVRYTFSGTHKGELMGIPPTNKKVTIWQIDIHRIVGGKLVESWSMIDTLGAMQQLGLAPTPGKGR